LLLLPLAVGHDNVSRRSTDALLVTVDAFEVVLDSYARDVLGLLQVSRNLGFVVLLMDCSLSWRCCGLLVECALRARTDAGWLPCLLDVHRSLST